MNDVLFSINNLGETPKTSGSVPVDAVRARFELTSEQQPSNKQYDQFFRESERSQLTDEEYRLMQKWRRLSEATDAGFRVEAYIRVDLYGRRRIETTLCTEVVNLAEDTQFWNKVHAFVRSSDGRIEWEGNYKNHEHSWRCEKDGTKIEGTDEYGPHYGKLERQVGIYWVLPGKSTVKTVKRFKKILEERMRQWELLTHQVAVL